MSSMHRRLIQCLLFISLLSRAAMAQLSPTFYSSSCPKLEAVVQSGMKQAVSGEPPMGASILRLFFHDCFVQGCDASILLDAGGEKTAAANANSVRGYEVIDAIKTSVEAACPGVVSCADILPLAARDGTVLLGGPTWAVPLGRRDSTTASPSLANSNLPPSSASLATLITLFGNQGLSPTDMTALSGAHTIGQARCTNFRGHIYSDGNINASFAAQMRQACPQSGGDGTLAPLDEQTPAAFDNAYYQNLVAQRGLMHSDQELFNGGSQDSLVRQYSTNAALFQKDFVAAMIKMGSIKPLTGTAGQIRAKCGVVGQAPPSSPPPAKNNSSPPPQPPPPATSPPVPQAKSAQPPPTKSNASSPTPPVTNSSPPPATPGNASSPMPPVSPPPQTNSTVQPSEIGSASSPTSASSSASDAASDSASSSAASLLVRCGALWLSTLISAYLCVTPL